MNRLDPNCSTILWQWKDDLKIALMSYQIFSLIGISIRTILGLNDKEWLCCSGYLCQV